MLEINQKVKVVYNDEKEEYGYVTETWPADEYHQAGFRVGFNKKDGFYERPEFKEDEIGVCVFPIEK